MGRENFLPCLEGGQHFLRGQAFQRKSPLEPQAGIVQEFVQGVAVGLEFAGGLFHWNILYGKEEERLALAVGQFLGQ